MLTALSIRDIVLVDDILHTGRTIRAALERDPDLELGSCVLIPTFWVTKCKDCGHEVTLGETTPTFRPPSADE